MKTLKLIIIGMILVLASATQAQISIHIPAPPMPPMPPSPPRVPSVPQGVRYYYIPDAEAYYDNQTSMYIYFSGGAWIRNAYLPGQYRNYDWHRGYNVPMNGYRGSFPYSHFKEDRNKYARGNHGPAQRNNGNRGQSNQRTNQGNGRNAEHGHEGNGNRK